MYHTIRILIRFLSVFKQLEMSQIAANGDNEIILEISRSSFTDLTDPLAKFYYVLIGNWSYHYPSNCWIQDATEKQNSNAVMNENQHLNYLQAQLFFSVSLAFLHIGNKLAMM